MPDGRSLLFLMALSSATLVAVGVSARQTALGDVTAAAVPRGSAEAAALRERGLELGYNLDHDEALAAFKEAIAADPAHPAAYRLIAASMWIHLLFEQGAVTVEDYLGQTGSRTARKPAPDVDVVFRGYISRALTLAEERRRAHPKDADGPYQTGAAHGFLATYTATAEGRVLGGFRPARRAYDDHKRVLEVDPGRKDAGLIVGMYRYAIAALPAPMRLVARIAGFEGGREHGLRLVEDASRYPSDVQTNALFTLIVMYNREARYADALDVIGRLQRRYPRNRLLWLEAGSTALRAGRALEAKQAIEDGLAKLAADSRPRAFGEEARWRYYHGAALVALKDTESAERELRAVLVGDAHAWVQGRAHMELGKLADLAGNRTRAVEEYRRAARICRAERDSICSNEAGKLVTTRYR